MNDDEKSIVAKTTDQVIHLGINGVGPFKSAIEVAEECLRDSNGDFEAAIERSLGFIDAGRPPPVARPEWVGWSLFR